MGRMSLRSGLVEVASQIGYNVLAMGQIKIYKKIEVTDPVMIAGWPGMGNVAYGAVNYLQKKLGGTKFAEALFDRLATLDSVIVEDGIAVIPEPPKNTFYCTKNPDLIIFEGEAQVPGQAGIDILNKVLDLAVEMKVKKIYTGAAFPLPISHKDPSTLYGVAGKKPLRDSFVKLGIKAMEDGHISGLNGLMLGFAQQRGVDAVCLLATIPQYAISLPNPKASWAIIQMLSHILKFKVDPAEMNEYIKDMDEKMSIIEDRVKEVFPIEKAEPESFPADKKVPAYIMEKIEKLFREARTDKSKAIILKKELDRWDLYKVYEDRFLDLFKESQ